MPKDKKGGLAILIAGKPTKDVAEEDEDYEGEDVPEPADEEEEEPYAESEYPEFDIPEGLDLSDLEEGEEKEVLAIVRRKPGNTACIISVDGVNLTGAEEAPAVPQELPSEAPPGESMPPTPIDIGARARAGGLM